MLCLSRCTISDTAKVNLESCDFWNSVFVSRSILLSELWRFISFVNAQPPSDLLLLTQAMTPACFIIWIALSIACSDATFFSFARALVKTQVKAFLSHLRSRCRLVLDSCGRGCCLMKGISKWREGVDLQYFTVPLSFPAVAYKEMDKIARAAGISFCFCIQKFVTHFQTFSSYCRKASSGALATERHGRDANSCVWPWTCEWSWNLQTSVLARFPLELARPGSNVVSNLILAPNHFHFAITNFHTTAMSSAWTPFPATAFSS